MTFEIDELLARVRSTVHETGASLKDARLVAEVLVGADIRGHSSHGIGLLPVYLERVRCGGIDPRARTVMSETGSLASVDANGGFGQIAAMQAAHWCAEAAVSSGISAASVRHNNHVGMMAAYREPFQRHGVIGLLLNISGPSLLAPGAQRPTLGSSAVCLVTPTSTKEPFVIDFATGIVSLGKIRAAAQRGDRVPPEWLRDRRGMATSDPEELEHGGSVPIFGEYKGLGLTLMTEILAGALAGGTISPRVAKQRQSPEKPMNCSQLFIGLSVQAFGHDSLDPLLDELRRAVAAGYASEPVQPWYPDQIEHAHTVKVSQNGVTVPTSVVTALGWSQ